MRFPDDDSFHQSLSGRVASPDTGGMLSSIGLADAPVGENVVAVRESFPFAPPPVGASKPVGGACPSSAFPAGACFLVPFAIAAARIVAESNFGDGEV